MNRALRELRIRGVSSSLQFLGNVIADPLFRSGECTTRFIDATAELLQFEKRHDRAARLLDFLGEVAVNGNPETARRTALQRPLGKPVKPQADFAAPPRPGSRDLLKRLGPAAFAD